MLISCLLSCRRIGCHLWAGEAAKGRFTACFRLNLLNSWTAAVRYIVMLNIRLFDMVLLHFCTFSMRRLLIPRKVMFDA